MEFTITEKSDFSREVIFVIHFALQKKRSQLSPDEAGCGIAALKFCLFSLVDPCPVGRNYLHLLGAVPKHEGERIERVHMLGPTRGILQHRCCTRGISSSGNSRESRSAKMISESHLSSDQHIRLSTSHSARLGSNLQHSQAAAASGSSDARLWLLSSP